MASQLWGCSAIHPPIRRPTICGSRSRSGSMGNRLSFLLKVDSHLSVPRSCRPSLVEPQFSRKASYTVFLTLTPPPTSRWTDSHRRTHAPSNVIRCKDPHCRTLGVRGSNAQAREFPYGAFVGDGRWTARVRLCGWSGSARSPGEPGRDRCVGNVVHMGAHGAVLDSGLSGQTSAPGGPARRGRCDLVDGRKHLLRRTADHGRACAVPHVRRYRVCVVLHTCLLYTSPSPRDGL